MRAVRAALEQIRQGPAQWLVAGIRLGALGTAAAADAAARARHRKDDAHTFEDWVTTRFGRRLYDSFFRSYTEKVWGIPGSQIRSLWAAQRIKNFSLGRAIMTILGLQRENVTTLIEEFDYPRLGPGQMWEAFAKTAEDAPRPAEPCSHGSSWRTSRPFAPKCSLWMDVIELVRGDPAPLSSSAAGITLSVWDGLSMRL